MERIEGERGCFCVCVLVDYKYGGMKIEVVVRILRDLEWDDWGYVRWRYVVGGNYGEDKGLWKILSRVD